ncbi:coadhesin-like [Gigantopelta aegis]|uniref:coadhesin-like n=1 Tax=Gigantopelta aegis TaxID=1735272 RepID=UPI001B889F2A|nr:coadhesin-like [Gigantopelta aegis]
MNIQYFLLLGLLFAVLLVETASKNGKKQKNKDKLVCFRKLKKNGKCSGIVRKRSFTSPEACCSRRGHGFAWKKEKLRKNRFRCTPCNTLMSSKKDHDMQILTKLKPIKGRKYVDFTTRMTFPENQRPPVIRGTFPTEDPNAPKIEWGPWSPCSSTCGAGWRSRYKVCDNCDMNDYENAKVEPCVVNFWCPQDGNWGPWFPWQPCTQSCEGGTRIRQRKCNYPPPAYGGQNCPGQGKNNQTCNEKSCPVDGSWSDWSDFLDCSVTCGHGTMMKRRRCDSPAPANGGRNCHGPSTFTKKCDRPRCPQDGGWSLWGTWRACAVTCGEGMRQRYRSCDSPKPMYGGKDCDGSPVEQMPCSGGRPCPVDGGWSPWTNFGFCRALQRCQTGFQVRSRTCTNPRPLHGGKQCPGQQYERVKCFNDKDCPKNGSWCEWGKWSTCSATCQINTALRVRERECRCPVPENGGAGCEGEAVEVKGCARLPECDVITKAKVRDNVDDDDDSDSSGAGFTND